MLGQGRAIIRVKCSIPQTLLLRALKPTPTILRQSSHESTMRLFNTGSNNIKPKSSLLRVLGIEFWIGVVPEFLSTSSLLPQPGLVLLS